MKYFSFKTDENWETFTGRQKTMPNSQNQNNLIVSDVDIKNSTRCDKSHQYPTKIIMLEDLFFYTTILEVILESVKKKSQTTSDYAVEEQNNRTITSAEINI